MSYLSYSIGTAVPGVSQTEREPGKTDEQTSSASEQGVLLIVLVLSVVYELHQPYYDNIIFIGSITDFTYEKPHIHAPVLECSQQTVSGNGYDPATYLDRDLEHDNEKLKLLNDRWEPPSDFNFPSSSGHKYQSVWESEYSWLRCSNSKDSAFCAHCLLIRKKVSGRGVHQATFLTVGFRDWKNAKGANRGALQLHETTETHKNATIKAAAFKDIAAGKTKDIHSSLSKAYEEQIKKKQKIMLSIIDMVVVLGQRNIPFRGHGWSRELKKEKMEILIFSCIGNHSLIPF